MLGHTATVAIETTVAAMIFPNAGLGPGADAIGPDEV
jgi:hypothetical protein